MNQSPRSASISSSISRWAAVFLVAASVGAQSRIIRPLPQNNSNSGKRTHVATVRSSDSPEGSRVAISSDQSLNNYEAYRRGDRFYVKIPAADVPRAEAVRGRGFADVKAQRAGDSTVVSFRLQPGATAHVEQRANKLDVVVSVPGGGSANVASNRTSEATRPKANNSNRSAEGNKRSTPPVVANKNTNSNKNSSARTSAPTSGLNNSNSNTRPRTTPTPKPKATPTPIATPSPKSSASLKSTPTPAQKAGASSSTTPTPSPAMAGTQPQGDFWARTKERAHYWILLAQLNPIPVGVGALLLVLVIGLLLFQRRRARSTRRVKSASTKRTVSAVSASGAEASASQAEAKLATEAAAETVAKHASSSETAPPIPLVVSTPVSAAGDDVRKERVNRVADEARKVFAGEPYDESIIGSNDPETRRLVGAELSSALVGRNAERRESARVAFMKHGYFDDATRDLRVAESENERAAAARRLSFVNDRDATPHLIGALGDPAPDVRRAAVEALMDLRDPAAIAPLNSLMQSETDRKVPRNLIQHAIDACATGVQADASAPPTDFPVVSEATPQPIETEREVIEL